MQKHVCHGSPVYLPCLPCICEFDVPEWAQSRSYASIHTVPSTPQDTNCKQELSTPTPPTHQRYGCKLVSRLCACMMCTPRPGQVTTTWTWMHHSGCAGTITFIAVMLRTHCNTTSGAGGCSISRYSATAFDCEQLMTTQPPCLEQRRMLTQANT